MKKLFQQVPAYNEGYLKVSPTHEIYFEESGNPKGKSVIVFHGGPGSKSKPKYRKFFNPKKWRVVMFDQRGCGKSKPLGKIKDNTTWDLVEDAEKIRKHLGIEGWVVFGGSWGSTLGLAYSQKYPSVVTGMILRGIWLCRNKDIDWLLKGKELKNLFPDLWDWRVENLEKLGVNTSDLLNNLYSKLFSKDVKEQKLATIIFENWEGQFLKVDQEIKLMKIEEVKKADIASNRILMHYIVNNCFFKQNQLLNDIDKLPNVPTVIIHGRYDVICPVEQAWELHKVLPKARFEIIPASGHHSFEEGILSELVEETERFAKL